MNERIRELAEQAGIKITPMVVDGVEYEYEDVEMDGSEDLEKFAELIVRECVGIVEKNESEMHYDNGMYPVYPTVCEIREHFGVEE